MLTPSDVNVIINRLSKCRSKNYEEAQQLVVMVNKLSAFGMSLQQSKEKSDGDNSDKGQQKP